MGVGGSQVGKVQAQSPLRHRKFGPPTTLGFDSMEGFTEPTEDTLEGRRLQKEEHM